MTLDDIILYVMLADIISMIITHHREKLTNAIIYFAENTKYCGKTKLLKLLYFLDFCHFKQAGMSVTCLDYFAWEIGPVSKVLFDELSGNMRADMKDIAAAIARIAVKASRKI